MEDDEEIESHPSRGSGSMDRRITVAVASAPPPQNTLTLALPIQQPKTVGGGGGGGGGGGREDCWSEGATAVLIEAWGERYMELSRGNLKQKHWKEVADVVNSREDFIKAPKTDVQCKNRIDTVKKKYKVEKAKIASGGGRSNWRFFDRMEQLIGPSAAAKSGSSSLAPPSSRDVPIGIPVGVRPAQVQSLRLKQQQQQFQIQQQRKRLQPPPVDTDSSQSEPEQSPDSPDSDSYNRKRPRVPFRQKQQDQGREKKWGDSVRELTKAIIKFGEVYEQTESSKLQQMVEMEKQRMKFAKELELERLQLFMKTQMEMSQLKHNRRGVDHNNNNHHHNHSHNHRNNNNNAVNDNHSDDDNN